MDDEVSMNEECASVNVMNTGQCVESSRSHSVGVYVSESDVRSVIEGSGCRENHPQCLGSDTGWLREAPTDSTGSRGTLMLSGTEKGKTTGRDDLDHLRDQTDVEVGQVSLPKQR